MSEDQTLFAHLTLTQKFADHPENIAVEALGHILSKSPAARRALEDVLQDGGAKVGKIAWVKTQPSGEEGTRPDLAGFDQNNKESVLIEAKFWAGLTDNQPVAYLERLPQNQSSALLFVAPATRLNTLRAELSRKVSESPSDIELIPDRNEEKRLWSAAAGGKRRLMLISWTALLERMESRASTAGESHTESDIRQLQGLAEQMDKEAFLPLRQEELSPEFPRRLINLRNLVNNIIECLEQKRLGDRKGYMTTNNMQYGTFLVLLSSAAAWFGFDPHKWATVRDTPLWLYFRDCDGWWKDVKLRPFSEIRGILSGLQEPPEFIGEDDELVIPIYLPVGVEEDAVCDAVVSRIEEIINLIKPAD